MSSSRPRPAARDDGRKMPKKGTQLVPSVGTKKGRRRTQSTELAAEAGEVVGGADLDIERRVRGDVVAVRRTGSSLQQRRRVHVADAKLGEVRQKPRGVGQCEAGV